MPLDEGLGCLGVLFDAVIHFWNVADHWRFWVTFIGCTILAGVVCATLSVDACVGSIIAGGVIGLILGGWWEYSAYKNENPDRY